MREIVHLQAGQCGNQIGAKVSAAACTNKTSPANQTITNCNCDRDSLLCVYAMCLIDNKMRNQCLCRMTNICGYRTFGVNEDRGLTRAESDITIRS